MFRYSAVFLLLLPVFVFAQQAGIETKYNKSCIACHASGAAGAPVSFNEEVWAPRLEKGDELLLANVINGYKVMPAKGLCFDCSEADFKALIKYMSTPK